MVNTPTNTVRHWRAIGYGPKTARIGRRVMVRRAEAERTASQAIRGLNASLTAQGLTTKPKIRLHLYPIRRIFPGRESGR